MYLFNSALITFFLLFGFVGFVQGTVGYMWNGCSTDTFKIDITVYMLSYL